MKRPSLFIISLTGGIFGFVSSAFGQYVTITGSTSVAQNTNANYSAIWNPYQPSSYEDWNWYPKGNNSLTTNNASSATVYWSDVGTHYLEYELITWDNYYWDDLAVTVTGSGPATPSTTLSLQNNCGNTLVTRMSSPPSTDYWYWQTSSTGTSTALGYAGSITRTATGPLYLRARLKASPYTWSTTSLNLGTINVKPAVTAAPTVQNASRCGEGSVTLSGTPGANANTLRWYTTQSGGTHFHTGTSRTETIAPPGKTYYVSSYHSTNLCESTARTAVTATVTAPSTVEVIISDPGIICSTQAGSVSFHVTNLTNGGTSPTYTWYRGFSGTTLAEDNQSGTPETYYPSNAVQHGEIIRCHVASSAYCTNADYSNSVTVQIQQATTPTVYIHGQTQMCESSPSTFTASSPQTISSYAWSIGESNTLSTLPSFTPATTDLASWGGEVRLTVGVNGSCIWPYTASSTLPVAVDAQPYVGTLSTNGPEFCSSGTVNLTLSSYFGSLSWMVRIKDGPDWGNWTTFSTTSSTSNTYSVESVSGIPRYYEFKVESTNGMCDPASTTEKGVTVYPNSAIGMLSTTNGTQFCSSAEINLSLSSYIGDLTWQYRYKDGTNGPYGNWQVFSTEEVASTTTPALSSAASVERIYEIQVLAKSGTCGTLPGDPTTVTIYPAPALGTLSISPGTEFYGTASPPLTISLSSSTGTITFESSTDGSSWIATSNPTNVSNPITYFQAKASSGPCPSVYSQTPLLVNLYSDPVITASGSVYLSYGNTVDLSTGSFDSYQWARDGANILGADKQNYEAGEPGVYTVTVKGSPTASPKTSVVFTVYDAFLSQNENYISTSTFMKEGVNPAALFSLQSKDYSQSTTYFDGLGRPMQTVVTMGSPAQRDIVQPVVYDEFGRELRKYLPFVPEQQSGRYINNGTVIDNASYDYIGDAGTFYDDPTSKVADDDGNKPFAETVFEDSPLNRVIEQGAPGSVWHPDTDKTIRMAYETNAANEVILWEYEPPSEGHPLGLVDRAAALHYGPNQLYKTVIQDEQDNEIIEYKDKEGRVVLKRVQAVNSPTAIDNTNYASTYYIYDDFGQLVCVIPPEASKRLATEYYHGAATDATKEEFLQRWAFRYRYDGRRRMVMKQVPGADSVSMVYDKRDRLVLTQDGNQRDANQWIFTKYDELNRPVVTGIYTHGSQIYQNQMTDLLDPVTVSEVYDGTTSNFGYSNTVFPTSGIAVLTVTYYDDYSFKTLLNDPGDEFDFKNDELSADGTLKGQDQQRFDRVKGQVTGMVTRVLNSSTWLSTVNYYDHRYRLIQSTSNNYKGGFDRITNVYDFVGKVLRTKTRYLIPGHPQNPDTEIFQRFSYDHAGRLLKTWHKIQGGDEVLLSANEYNELGELVTKKLHQTALNGSPVTSDPLADDQGTSYDTDIIAESFSNTENTYIAANSIRLLPGFTVASGETFIARIGYSAEDALAYNNAIDGEFLQTIDYRYNIRGWLKQVNNPSDPLTDDLFNMELRYHDPTTNGGEAQYNGNISEAVWKSAGLDKQSYGYDYDPMNRIMKGSYYNLARPTENGRYNETIGDHSDLEQFPAYDLNGNIQNLLRNGKTGGGTYGPMDKLHYDYGTSGGNRLMFVSDAQEIGAEEEGFKEMVEGTTDYDYDSNGNLIKDENKGITGDGADNGIEYNHLNLPEKVSKSATEYIIYTYDATGRKLKQEVFGATAKTTDYLGELVFEGNNLQFILHGEGRVVSDTEPGAPDPWEYQYFLKDHLGNTRVVFSEKKTSTEYKATLEDDTQSDELADFSHYPTGGSRNALPIFNHTDGSTTYTYSQLLHGGSNSQVGLAKSFEVNPGDVFDLEVFAKYEAPTQTATDVTALLSQLVSAFSLGAATSALDGAPAQAAFENLFQGGGPWINSSMWENEPPKAYLNYILFDENFALIDFGFDQINTGGEQGSPPPVTAHDYLSLHVKVEQKGYLYVYLSNEQPTLTNVYFDDMKIVHYSAVEQVSDYYPFGLTFNSYQRENSLDQKYLYNGIELASDLDLNVFTAKFRNLDPTIGRWWQLDPKPNHSISVYAAMDNNPIRYSDPLGDTIKFDPGVSKKFIRQFNRATAKLMEKGVGGHFSRLHKSKKVYTVKEVKGKSGSYFDPKKQEFGWNAKLGMITNNGKTLSPATVLNHEFDHGAKWDRDPKGFTKDGATKIDGYGNKEEERVIKGSEQRTAREMGEISYEEVTRTDHFGTLFPMKHSTSTELDDSEVPTVTPDIPTTTDDEDENE